MISSCVYGQKAVAMRVLDISSSWEAKSLLDTASFLRAVLFLVSCSHFRNFARVSSGPEMGAYYHEFFLRDKPHLAVQMFCKNARTMIALATDSKPAPILSSMKENHALLASSQHLPQQQATGMRAAPVKDVDGALEIFLRNQQLDPVLQMLLKEQLNLGRPHEQKLPQIPLAAISTSDCQHLYELQDHQARHNRRVQKDPSAIHSHNPMLAFGHPSVQAPATIGVRTPSMSVVVNESSLKNAHPVGNSSSINYMNPLQQMQSQKQEEAQMMQLRQLIALNLQRQQNRDKSGARNFRASAA